MSYDELKEATQRHNREEHVVVTYRTRHVKMYKINLKQNCYK